MVEIADLNVWGKYAGSILWDSIQQQASFQYDAAFLKEKIDLAPFAMPISQGNTIHVFPELRKQKNEQVSTFKGLPGLIADSLPDRYGSQLMDIWLAQNGRATDSMNPVEQLCFIGTRGMGALEYQPAPLESKSKSFSVEVDSLVEIAHKLLQKKEDYGGNLHINEYRALLDILKVGTSAGGARPKAVIAFNEKTGNVLSGQTNVPVGYDHWLLKLDGVTDVQFGETKGYGRIEYAYYLMAKDCGIDMMECRLMEENNRAHFMTKRYDRGEGSVKHHVQTLCAIRHFDYTNLLGYSYEQVFQTMRMLRLSYPEAEQMFRRMVFNVLATNCDDHTKNFSFMLKEGGRWELTPAYDVCYSYDPTNIWVNQQTLSVNGKRNAIELHDFLAVAEANSIEDAEQIVKEIKEIVECWKDYASKAKVSTTQMNKINKNLRAHSIKMNE